MAKNINSPEYSKYPVGYPIILSIAYSPSADKVIIYHIMLAINCFLSSLIIFPAYFILSKFCPKGYSLFGSFVVAALPTINLYSFLLLSENLFTPLFIFSIFAIIKTYESKSANWILIALLSVVGLFFTRHAGIIMLFGFFISFIFYIIAYGPKERRNINYFILILILSIFFGYLLIRTNLMPMDYLKWFGDYSAISYNVIKLFIFDKDFSLNIVFLFFNGVRFLILSSYFIFLIFFVLLLLSIIGYKKQENPIYAWFESLNDEEKLGFKMSIIYFTSSGFISLLAIPLRVPGLQIYTRYLDPFIPGIFIFGLIALNKIYGYKIFYKNFLYFIIILFICLFALKFPEILPDAMTIYYIKFLKDVGPTSIVFAIVMTSFLIVFYLFIIRKQFYKGFLAYVILFSICISAYALHSNLFYHSDFMYKQNQIGTYLYNNSNDKTITLIDEDDVTKDRVIWYMTRFWAQGPLIIYEIPYNLSEIDPIYVTNNSYIISSKGLFAESVASSFEIFNLYRLDNENFRSSRSLIKNFNGIKTNLTVPYYRLDFKEISNMTKPSLYQHPLLSEEGQISFSNISIRDSTLKFSIALDPAVWSPEKGDGVIFNIYISKGGANNLIFSKYINPKQNPNERKWNEFMLNLSTYQTENATLIFSTLPGPVNDNAYDWAYWGDLELSTA
ncbi:MAG: hypothetical protein MUO26_16115 [Methanotrichaceae archaeon]|nr:hypothetical protein [Methanotrichaceae archaeon]